MLPAPQTRIPPESTHGELSKTSLVIFRLQPHGSRHAIEERASRAPLRPHAAILTGRNKSTLPPPGVGPARFQERLPPQTWPGGGHAQPQAWARPLISMLADGSWGKLRPCDRGRAAWLSIAFRAAVLAPKAFSCSSRGPRARGWPGPGLAAQRSDLPRPWQASAGSEVEGKHHAPTQLDRNKGEAEQPCHLLADGKRLEPART